MTPDLTAIGALVRAGQTEVDNVDGGTEDSRFAPVTRSDDDQAVRQVPRQRQVDPVALAKEDLSAIAIGLQQVAPITIPPEFHARGQALVNEVERLQQLGFEMLDGAEIAEQNGDFGLSSALKIEAGVTWAKATPLRAELDQMVAMHQQAYIHNDRIGFQQTLLHRHPWAGSQKALDACIRWASKEYGVSEQEILSAHPQDILAGAAQYELAMKRSGKSLTRESVSRQAHGADTKARASKMRSKNNGRLTPQQQHELVAEMLRGVIL